MIFDDKGHIFKVNFQRINWCKEKYMCLVPVYCKPDQYFCDMKVGETFTNMTTEWEY